MARLVAVEDFLEGEFLISEQDQTVNLEAVNDRLEEEVPVEEIVLDVHEPVAREHAGKVGLGLDASVTHLQAPAGEPGLHPAEAAAELIVERERMRHEGDTAEGLRDRAGVATEERGREVDS